MDKKFVKLGEKYYYIEADEKGLRLTPATDNNVVDEMLEQSILIDPSEEAGDNFLQTIIDQTKDDMIRELKSGLKGTVLKCLGLQRSRWGEDGYEVDHCNGRMSEVSEHISISIKEILKDTTLEDLQLSKGERKDIIAAYKKDMLSQYKRNLQQNIWKAVEAQAKQDTADLAKELLEERRVEIAKLMLDRLLNNKS